MTLDMNKIRNAFAEKILANDGDKGSMDAALYHVAKIAFEQGRLAGGAPIEFEIPKKPKKTEKAWQWIYKAGERYWLTPSWFASREVLEYFPNAEHIEPYLPSEIEREVKE